MRTMRSLAVALISAAALVGVSTPKDAAAVGCSALNASETLAGFTSCTGTGNDDLTTINGIVQALFSDAPDFVGPIDGASSFGPGADNEAHPEFSVPGLSVSPADVNGNITFEFTALPPNILFISFKQGSGFELFDVPGGTPFTLTHNLDPNNSTSHIALWSATAVPLPATLPLLAAGLGAFAFAARRRRAA